MKMSLITVGLNWLEDGFENQEVHPPCSPPRRIIERRAPKRLQTHKITPSSVGESGSAHLPDFQLLQTSGELRNFIVHEILGHVSLG